MKYADLISQLTLEEKAALCSGKDFWHLVGVERLGIPSIMVTDGPHGLRKQNQDKTAAGDILGNSVPATCFPPAVATGCTWNPELIYEMGQALGEECLKEKVSVLLGPGINIKRSPLCGRNFEYFSEDPVVAGNMGAAFINGVQSKGVGTSLKHFAANNQECRRMTISTVADERTLREIYLTAFELCVKNAQPWTVMNAYNKINGTYCAENKWLLNDVLRDEWGFEGIVVTDWGAENEIVDGLKAGQNLEMPGSGGYGPNKLVKAVQDGTLDEAILDKNVDSVLELIMKSKESYKDDYECDMEKHHALARKIAGEGIVLLKNDDNILPLQKAQKIAVIGEMAKSPRYQGAGSSLINPTYLDDAYSELLRNDYNIAYAQGYDKSTDVPDDKLISQATELAKKADTVLLFIGLTEIYESEGFDRRHIDLPPSHNKLVEEVAKVNENLIVVLSGGSAVSMPWLNSVKAVVNGLLLGQAGGSAIADVLAGKVNPSGKLTETYPLCLEDTPARENFPGKQLTVEYREGIFVGYRYYDKMKKEVLFPFGYGLSYTTFSYDKLKLSKKKIKDTDSLTVSFKVKNTGDVAGAEVAQLYVSAPEGVIFRAPKELKGFKKFFLEPGEEKVIEITLSKRDFAYYNVNINDYHVESGDYEILVGASSRDIRLQSTVSVKSTVEAQVPDYKAVSPEYYTGDPSQVADASFEAVLGFSIPQGDRDPSLPIDPSGSLELAAGTPRGDKVIGIITAAVEKIGGGGINSEMMRQTAFQIPIRCFITMSGGVVNDEMCEGICDLLNGKPMAKCLVKIGKNVPGALLKVPAMIKSM
ncbi:MAG: glycoside hydrolase family 3 C-terminal domain-containing protein [Clostridia bacterium]|nr:glycoside hydrolase family 3 C-terminal domain-containing protein [Clostridia bacterium]